MSVMDSIPTFYVRKLSRGRMKWEVTSQDGAICRYYKTKREATAFIDSLNLPARLILYKA